MNNTSVKIISNPPETIKHSKNTVIPKIFAPTKSSNGPISKPAPKNTHLNLSIKSYITLDSIYGQILFVFAVIINEFSFFSIFYTANSIS